ncbi:MAG: At domain protein [Bacteroidetes bacterium]|jgi:hypothetical protein|nr:At domain protein [Bacteroidota bacterium]
MNTIKMALLLVVLLVTGANAQTYKNGEKLMAFEDDDNLWYEATILEAGATHSKIHWEGFSAEYDETLTNKRFWRKGDPFLAGDELQGMETDGKWYNIKILKNGTGTEKYLIHWAGFSSDYDRYLSYDSIRLPTKANTIPKPASNASQSGSASATRISVVYLENKTGQTISWSISGDGMSNSGTIYKGQKSNISRAPIGATLYVNKQAYIKISGSHDGQTIVIK